MQYHPPIPEISRTMVAYGIALITERHKSVAEVGRETIVFDTKDKRFIPGIPASATAPFYATVSGDAGSYNLIFHRGEPDNVTEERLNLAMLQIVAPELIPKLAKTLLLSSF